MLEDLVGERLDDDLRRFGEARPGRLGLGFYTLRVRALEAMRERVLAAKATEVSAVVPDEFGRPACSIRAPDGCSWTLIGA